MRSRVIALLAVALVTLPVSGYLIGRRQLESKESTSIVTDKFSLLASRIFVTNAKEPFINFSDLRVELRKYFQDNQIQGSLYFEYLPTGTQVRVQDEEKDQAASLLKVPLAMEVYRAVEVGKIKLDDQITLREEWLDPAFGDLYRRGAGAELTVQEAIEIMLKDSDNTALKALVDKVNGLLPSEDSVFNFVDIEITQNVDLSVSMGARAYSSILKCLYFSCYLSNEHSQQILEYLSDTPFNTRLVAGIRNSKIKIAHKIGVFQEVVQSDCGIVYVPERPYVVCIAIEGRNNDETDKKIADISKKIYEYVTQK